MVVAESDLEGTSAAASAPEPEPDDTFTAEAYTRTQILNFVRHRAAAFDPRHASLYAQATPQRIMDAAALASDLLARHRLYLHECHRYRGKRRPHSAEIHALIEGTNEATLVLALSWVEAAFALMPPIPSGTD